MANYTRFQLRGDTRANWLSVNPILALNEPAIETDTKRFKIGDGVSTYSQLSYGRNTGEYASVYNVTSLYPLPSGFYEHSTAILAIPSGERTLGLIITYETASGVWYTERFIGTDIANWGVAANWEKLPDAGDLAQLRSDLSEINDKVEQVKDGGLKDGSIELPKLSPTLAAYIGSGGEVTNQADDDDLENIIINGVPVIREKTTKTYNPENYSGMGNAILRKNMVNGVSVLTQEMINQPNTIYEIRYDFYLNGQEITVPEGCVLYFQGGSISNGVIVGNNTKINAGLQKIFNLTINLIGTWSIDKAYSEWFGAVGNGIVDDTAAIQKTIKSVESIIINTSHGDLSGGISIDFLPKIYNISSSIRISESNIYINGNNATFMTNFSSYGILFIIGSAENWYNDTFFITKKYINLQNFKIKKGNNSAGVLAILFTGTRNSNILNVLIEEQEIGVYTEDSSEFNYTNISCIGCGVSFIFDSRFNRTNENTPLNKISGNNDCSSGIVVNPTSYYSQKNCVVCNSVGNIEITGATFGMFAERSEDSDCTLPYGLGSYPGKSVIIMPNIDNGNAGFVRSFKLNNCVFEANKTKKSSCVYLYSNKSTNVIENVHITDCVLQTYSSMNFDNDIFTTFIETNVKGKNNLAKVDNCTIESSTSGYLYPCFFREVGDSSTVIFNNCNPKIAFSRGFKTKLIDDMVVKKDIDLSTLQVGNFIQENGKQSYSMFINNNETLSFRAVDWNATYYGVKLEYEGSYDDLVLILQVNEAPDTNTNINSAINIGRYSNTLLPFDNNDNKKNTILMAFIPFDANYGFTSFSITVGSKNLNSIKIYKIQAGIYNINGWQSYNPFS